MAKLCHKSFIEILKLENEKYFKKKQTKEIILLDCYQKIFLAFAELQINSTKGQKYISTLQKKSDKIIWNQKPGAAAEVDVDTGAEKIVPSISSWFVPHCTKKINSAKIDDSPIHI